METKAGRRMTLRRRRYIERRRRQIRRCATITGLAVTLALAGAISSIASSSGKEPEFAIETEAPGNAPAVIRIMSFPEETTDDTVYITTEPATDPVTAACAVENGTTEETFACETKARIWGDSDREILARIAMAEAEGESIEGKALVIAVILNRVNSAGFPDSIEDVVFDKTGGSYQFSSVAPGGRYWTKEPNEDCYKAVDLVESGWDETQGATFFEATYNKGTWHKNHLKRLFQYGGHIFYTTKV